LILPPGFKVANCDLKGTNSVASAEVGWNRKSAERIFSVQ